MRMPRSVDCCMACQRARMLNWMTLLAGSEAEVSVFPGRVMGLSEGLARSASSREHSLARMSSAMVRLCCAANARSWAALEKG